jgi:hypothetical protein
MPHRLTVSVLGALLAASLIPPVAQAGVPATVSVRVEAPGGTIVETTLTTTRAAVVKDGSPAHACSGTSAAGALEQATGGRWTASWTDGLGYAIDAIDGVEPVASIAHWALWLDGKATTTPVCATELRPGDQVLEFVCSPTPDRSSCTNLPLELRPGRIHIVHSGASVMRVQVVRLRGDGTSEPVAGAIVRGGLKPVTTGADGGARVTLAWQSLLRATHAGDLPSGTLGCVIGDGGGSCASGDRTAPASVVQGLRPGQSFALADAPRELDGVTEDPGGIASVELRLIRHAGGRCAGFNARSGTFRPCKRLRFFDIGDQTHWSYLLPRPLRPGRYRLVVRATDRAGNALRRVLRFTVKAL